MKIQLSQSEESFSDQEDVTKSNSHDDDKKVLAIKELY